MIFLIFNQNLIIILSELFKPKLVILLIFSYYLFISHLPSFTLLLFWNTSPKFIFFLFSYFLSIWSNNDFIDFYTCLKSQFRTLQFRIFIMQWWTHPNYVLASGEPTP